MVDIRKTGIAQPGDVHVDTGLTMVSVAYKEAAEMFLADKVFPKVQVKRQSDLFLSSTRTTG